MPDYTMTAVAGSLIAGD